MADKIEFSLSDPDNALKKLKALPEALRKKGARFALRKAANVVAAAAKENARKIDDPETARNISDNIAVRFSNRTFKKTGDLTFRVGVLGGARKYSNTRENVRKGRAGQTYLTEGSSANPGGDTWYWRLVEFGTSRSRARPFLRPALEQNIEKATSEFMRQLDRWIGRNLKKIDKV